MRQRQLGSLSPEEHRTVLEMALHHPQARVREHALMVLLSEQGLNVKQVAQCLGRCPQTVSARLNAFQAQGFLGLYDQPIPGRPPQLTQEQRQQLEQWLQHSPRKQGYQQSNWSLKLLRHHIHKSWGIRVSISHLSRLLRQHGWRRIRPRHRSHAASEQAYDQAKRLILETMFQARQQGAKLFFLDETLAQLWPSLALIWAKQGSRPEIPMGDNHARIYVFAAANPFTGRVHSKLWPRLNQQGMLAFLKQMRRRYPGQKLVFILDNASAHHGKQVARFVEEDGQIELVFLPPYTAVHCNPIERLFKWFRRCVTHNEYFESVSELKAAIQAFFRAVANLPNRVVRLLNQLPRIQIIDKMRDQNVKPLDKIL